MTSVGEVLNEMKYNDDLPLKVIVIKHLKYLKKGQVFEQVIGDPTGAYKNIDSTVFIYPWFVRKNLENGCFEAVKESQEEMRYA